MILVKMDLTETMQNIGNFFNQYHTWWMVGGEGFEPPTYWV